MTDNTIDNITSNITSNNAPGATCAQAAPFSISVNGENHHTSHTTLSGFLATIDTGDMFAVARNGEFVPKSQHATTALCEGDTLDIVTPVGGG